LDSFGDTHVRRESPGSISPQNLPLVFAAASLVAAGGFIHLREWLDTYRHVPSSVPGSAVVRVGFPLSAGLSLLVAIALLITLVRRRWLAPFVVGAAIVFEASSLMTLMLSRTGDVFGWTEPVWTHGANQTRAVEIGAIAVLAALIAVGRLGAGDEGAGVEPRRREGRPPTLGSSSPPW
jgi:hypothetical protein